MALMTWNDSLSTGVTSMDEQHKGLMNVLNDLHAAMLKGQDRAATGALLATLLKYTHAHFAAEEALLRRANYSGLAVQIGKHRDLTGQVQHFVQRHQRGEIAINVGLLTFLREWLVTHIQKEDREYGPWLNQRGVR